MEKNSANLFKLNQRLKEYIEILKERGYRGFETEPVKKENVNETIIKEKN